jgi:hypothetical protein
MVWTWLSSSWRSRWRSSSECGHHESLKGVSAYFSHYTDLELSLIKSDMKMQVTGASCVVIICSTHWIVCPCFSVPISEYSDYASIHLNVRIIMSWIPVPAQTTVDCILRKCVRVYVCVCACVRVCISRVFLVCWHLSYLITASCGIDRSSHVLLSL